MNQKVQEYVGQVQVLVQELMALPVKLYVMHGGHSPERPRKPLPSYIFIYIPAKNVSYASLIDDRPFGYSAIVMIKDNNDQVEIRIDSRGLTITPLKSGKHRHVRVPLPMKVDELTYDNGEFKVVFEIQQ